MTSVRRPSRKAQPIDAGLLETFLAVTEAGSLRAAAQRMKTTTSTLSRRLDLLERQLGARVLRRDARGIALTDAGALLHQRGPAAIEALVRLAEDARRGDDVPHGVLRVTAPLIVGAAHVAPIVGRLLRQFPDLSVDLDLSDELVDFPSSRFDAAIRSGVPADAAFVARTIAVGRMVTCASPIYLEERGRPRRPAELSRHECLNFGAFAPTREWCFVRRGRSERVAARIRGSFNAASSLIAAAVAGAGVIRLPEFVVAGLIRQGQLESLLDDSSDEKFTVYLIYRTGTPPAKLRVFIDAILEELPRHLQISPPSPARSIRQPGGTGRTE
jgi:DNA-binding transcriptional LysR family regulator